jgi:hypothetical protein
MSGKPAKQMSESGDDLARRAEEAPAGLLREFGGFLLHNKKWWLLPILVVLALLAGLVILAGPSVAPFIYTLF